MAAGHSWGGASRTDSNRPALTCAKAVKIVLSGTVTGPISTTTAWASGLGTSCGERGHIFPFSKRVSARFTTRFNPKQGYRPRLLKLQTGQDQQAGLLLFQPRGPVDYDRKRYAGGCLPHRHEEALTIARHGVLTAQIRLGQVRLEKRPGCTQLESGFPFNRHRHQIRVRVPAVVRHVARTDECFHLQSGTRAPPQRRFIQSQRPTADGRLH